MSLTTIEYIIKSDRKEEGLQGVVGHESVMIANELPSQLRMKYERLLAVIIWHHCLLLIQIQPKRTF